MKPVYLSIENFMCHEKSIIDFSQFNSALIVGKLSGNELYSNGVGKTTIFKAIEYALFNSSDISLEKIIRDDCKSCKVIFDFEIDSEVYRVVRTRTKKGASDLSLFKRISSDGNQEDIFSEQNSDKFWKDISGRRASDTEKDLVALIKINAKSFRSTVHFAQNDFSGITTATPEKRKTLLRENLSLSFYSKIEKIAKDKLSEFNKKIEKNSTIIENITSSNDDIDSFNEQIKANLSSLKESLKDKKEIKSKIELKLNEKNKISFSIEKFINDNKNLSSQLELSSKDLEKLKLKVEDLLKKKASILSEAKSLASELNKIKLEKEELETNDFSLIQALEKDIELTNDSLQKNKLQHSKCVEKQSQLKVPLSKGTKCLHCRQDLTEEYLDKCQQEIDKEVDSLNEVIDTLNKEQKELTVIITSKKDELRLLTEKFAKLEKIKNSLSYKEDQIKDKKKYYTEYNQVIEEYQKQINDKGLEIKEIQEKINLSSSSTLNETLAVAESEYALLIKEEKSIDSKIEEINNSNAVINHSLDKCKEEISKKIELTKQNKDLEKKSKIYPKVIEAFSSSGIPNLIIQNLLDELQNEANILLNNLKPGLQLQFVTEKENKKGSADETLDILYFVQGKERDYEQLSGAMKLSVNFSLKLGMSFLLQKMFDTKINLLLLDEIDQALDKAGVDAFADIIKFFQNDFTILVITHNDRLKDKFSSGILVEQNKDMVSNARVVSSW